MSCFSLTFPFEGGEQQTSISLPAHPITRHKDLLHRSPITPRSTRVVSRTKNRVKTYSKSLSGGSAIA